MKELLAKLRFISLDGTSNNGLTRLEVPKDPTQDPKRCTEWMVVDTPKAITQFLLERNKKHFSQAPEPTKLIDLLTKDAQFWSDFLWTSGGSLELLKCTYQVRFYKFATDATPYFAMWLTCRRMLGDRRVKTNIV